MPVDTENLSAREGFQKLAAQLNSSQGAGSDARLAVSEASNPHADLSPAGVDLMIRKLQGNEDYTQARAKLAADGGHTNIKKFESDVGSQVDPRAFQYNRMTPEQRTKYAASLSDTDRSAVQKSYNWLHGLGLVGN
jgi:hypothetical protein